MDEMNPDVLLHPVRIKILTALADREATPSEIAATAPDIPKASLYRHLNILRACGAIREVREYRVRGTFEKVYGLVTDSGPLMGLPDGGSMGAARIGDWLNGLIRTPTAADNGPQAQNGAVWSRSAHLSPNEAMALQAHIEHWLNEHKTPGDHANGKVLFDIRIETGDDCTGMEGRS